MYLISSERAYSISLFFVKSMFFVSLFDIIEAMKENTREKIYTISTVVVILMILAVGIFNWLPVLRQYFGLKEKEMSVAAEIEDINRESNEYVERIRRFQSQSEQVESVARQDKRVYPGEVVYVFSEKNRK